MDASVIPLGNPMKKVKKLIALGVHNLIVGIGSNAGCRFSIVIAYPPDMNYLAIRQQLTLQSLNPL